MGKPRLQALLSFLTKCRLSCSPLLQSLSSEAHFHQKCFLWIFFLIAVSAFSKSMQGQSWLRLQPPWGDTASDCLSASLQSVVRICCIRSFGHFITHLQGSILQFNSELGIFISIAQSEQDNLLHQAQAQFHMVSWQRWANSLYLAQFPVDYY